MKIRCLIIALCLTVFATSAATAQQGYRQIGEQGGVEVMVKYHPFGYNNLVVAFIKFVNANPYKVTVYWTPYMTCENLPVKKGYGAKFGLREKGTHEVNVWRSQACGNATLKNIRVEMHVKEEGY